MTDRQIAGIFSLAWGLALMLLIGMIYWNSAVSYRSESLPYQLEFFSVIYLVVGFMFHFSMISGKRCEWINLTVAVLSVLFLIIVNAYQLPRSAGIRYLLSLPIVLWVMAWLVISMADYRKIFDEEK